MQYAQKQKGSKGMEIVIDVEPKEIAALVVEIQRQPKLGLMSTEEIVNAVITGVQTAIRGRSQVE